MIFIHNWIYIFIFRRNFPWKAKETLAKIEEFSLLNQTNGFTLNVDNARDFSKRETKTFPGEHLSTVLHVIIYL